MKNYIKGIITGIAISTALIPTAAHAAGTVLSTDIGTVIDGAACKTYNVDGRTFVVAETLRGYGFDADWNENTRNLSITQNPYAHRTLLTADEVNIKKEDCPVGNPLMNILDSDVMVTVAGERVEGYNIDGQMVIPVRALEPYAYIEFDEEKRLVKIRGLQHYLDERYAAGNPNVTREVKEYSQKTNNWSYPLGTSGSSIDYNREGDIDYVDVTEVTATDTENGVISAYWGNPMYLFVPSGLYHFESCYDTELYKITNKDGTVLYEADPLHRQENNSERNYLITDDYAQALDTYSGRPSLYGYFVHDERAHYSYWPSNEEIDAPDMRFEKLAGGCAISENGFLYRILSFDDEERHFLRYNMADAYISRDGSLYEFASGYFHSSRKNSMFDKLIAENVKKAVDNNKCILTRDGDVIYNGEKLAGNVEDIVYTQACDGLCILTDGGEMLVGSYDDYKYGTHKIIAGYIKEIATVSLHPDYTKVIYFINENNELYSYSVKEEEFTKLGDNIAKIVLHGGTYIGNEPDHLYITTDGVLTDLENDYAADVKDACSKYEQYEIHGEHSDGTKYVSVRYHTIFYILKNDGTLWYYNYKDKELGRVKAFE